VTRLSAVVFDLFHTLADPEETGPRDFDRVREMARAFGVEEGWFRSEWEMMLPLLARSPDRPARRMAAHLRALGTEVDDRQMAAADDALGRYQDAALAAPVAGAVDALRTLGERGLRLGVLSNAHERDVRTWESSPLAALVDAVCMSCFIGWAKPEPEAYAAILDRLGVGADVTAFVGDGGADELPGARAAGFGLMVLVAGPAIRSGLRSPGEVAELEAEADLRIEDVESLPAVLEEYERPG
jgi:putative hydrolase of the HAD superfamily